MVQDELLPQRHDVAAPQRPDRSRTARQSIVIERPIEEVFDRGCALEMRAQWHRATVAGELSGPCGRQLGARCTETRRAADGATEVWELEITAFEQNAALTIEGCCDSAKVVERHIFERDSASAGHTRYTLTVELAGTSLSAGALQNQIVQILIDFRDRLEQPNSVRPSVADAVRVRRQAERFSPRSRPVDWRRMRE